MKVNKNTTIKILAACFAIIMWVYVMSEVNPRTTKQFSNINVVIKNAQYVENQSLAIIEPQEIKISVKVSGRTNDIFKITEKDIEAYVDLRGISKMGESRVPIYVNSLENVSIDNVYPKDALVILESIVTKDKPVKVQQVGNVKDGYSPGESISKPSTVLVKGPKSLVDSVSHVVATVDVTNYDKDISVNVPFKAVDDSGKEVIVDQKEPESVDVTIPVYKVKNVKLEPQIEGSAVEGFKITNIEPNIDTIDIRGYEETLSQISSIKTNPVDVSLITEDTISAVELIIPAGVELVGGDIEPQLNIKVEKIIEKTFLYTMDEIEYLNLDEGLEIDTENSSKNIRITIKGIRSAVNNLTKNDLEPWIDLNEFKEGSHNLDVNFNNINEVEISSKEPEDFNIILINKEINNGETDSEDGNN